MNAVKFAVMVLGIMMLLAAPAAAESRPASLEGARWIWTWPDAATNDTHQLAAGISYFRTIVTLPDKAQAKSAEVFITADNLFTLYVNGKVVGQSTTNPNEWNHPKRFNVAALLLPGRNFIAVEAVNTAPGPAGLLFKLIGQTADGQTISAVSDDNWKCCEKEEKNWFAPAFEDKDWQKAYVVGEYGVSPWNKFGTANLLAKTPLEMPLAPDKAPIDWHKYVAKDAASGAGKTKTPAAPSNIVEVQPPADYPWPEAVIFLGDDCSLYRGQKGGSYTSLSVTVFNPRNSKAFPEHDLPAPIKVGRKLYALKPARPGVTPKLLLDAGKGAIGSPSVTFDGKNILMSMALDGEPFFHIYRMAAEGGKPQRITDGTFHDIDPAELPDGRIVFTSTRIGTFEEYHNPPSRALFVMNADGTNIRPLTNTFVFDNEPEVMADGRIIFVRSDNFFDRGKVETLLHAIHPDGSEGYTEFGLDNGPEYGGRLRAFNCGNPAPMPDGRVAFVSGPGITIGRPGSENKDQQNLNMPAGDVAALPDNRLLCTIANTTSKPGPAKKGKPTVKHEYSYEKIGILELGAKENRMVVLYDSEGEMIHSPVFLGPRVRPQVLADKIDWQQADNVNATGYLFCQNARFTRNTAAGWPHVRAIRVLMGKGLTVRSSHSYIVHAGSEVTELGTIPLAPDGSFHVEVPADTAIAFQAVDAEGRSELNEMSWITVRPGEHRSCLGCHHPRQAFPSLGASQAMALRTPPVKLVGAGQPHRFRGNNAAVTGLMDMQFDRYREVASLSRHSETADPLATAGKEVTTLVAQLKSTDAGLRLSSVQRLAIFRDQSAAPALAESLADNSREVRVAAVMALASCGTRDSVPALLKALNDPEPLVAQGAAAALENLTGHVEEYNAFVEPPDRAAETQKWQAWFSGTNWDAIEKTLVGYLDSNNHDVIRRASVALGHTGSAAARAALRKYVTEHQDNAAILEWRKGHRGDGARFTSLDAMNPRPIQAAARALGYLKDSDSVAMLADTIGHNIEPETSNLFFSEACAEALGRIGTPQAEDAIIALFPKLKDYQNYSGWYGDHGALIACHSSPVHYFLAESLDIIGSTKAAPIVPALIRSVPTDPDRALFIYNDDYEAVIGRVIRRSNAEALVVETCLAVLGDAQAVKNKDIEDALLKVHGAWAGKPDVENRAAQILSLTCRDRKYEPRIRAALELYRTKPMDIQRVFDKGIPVVLQLPVKHWVCFFLARSLGNLADGASTDALIATLEKCPTEAASGYPDPCGPGVLFLHNDLTPCYRAAAAWALGRIGDRRAVPVLLKIIADLNNATDTRYAAAEALMRLAEPAHLEAIRSLAENYPEVSTRKAMLRVIAKLTQ